MGYVLLVVPFSLPLDADWVLEQAWLVQRSPFRFNTECSLRLQDSDHTRLQMMAMIDPDFYIL